MDADLCFFAFSLLFILSFVNNFTIEIMEDRSIVAVYRAPIENHLGYTNLFGEPFPVLN